MPTETGRGIKMTRSRILAALMILAGAVLAALPVRYAETPAPGTTVFTSRVVFEDSITETFAPLGAVRANYPQYADVDAETLAAMIHGKFFSETTLEAYRAAFINGPTGEREATPLPEGAILKDPLDIRDPDFTAEQMDVLVRALMYADAIDYGLVSLDRRHMELPVWAVVAPGALLVSFGLVMLMKPAQEGSSGHSLT
jgi:hypothetical protein